MDKIDKCLLLAAAERWQNADVLLVATQTAMDEATSNQAYNYGFLLAEEAINEHQIASYQFRALFDSLWDWNDDLAWVSSDLRRTVEFLYGWRDDPDAAELYATERAEIRDWI